MEMPMYFQSTNNVTLLFSFWSVHGPAGMVLSVFVVLLFTVLYELLKMWKAHLDERVFPSAPVVRVRGSSSSESSLINADTPDNRKKWLWRGVLAALHLLQVTLGYLLMLCVMSYNVWIFLGVLAGSLIGYFLSFPLLGKRSCV